MLALTIKAQFEILPKKKKQQIQDTEQIRTFAFSMEFTQDVKKCCRKSLINEYIYMSRRTSLKIYYNTRTYIYKGGTVE